MGNEFAVKPELDKNFPRNRPVWQCPITGLNVPKTFEQNILWREQILELADEDEEMQDDLFTACSQSILFFMNAFVFTNRLFEPDPETGEVKQAANAHIPMLAWEVQDEHLLWLEEHLDQGEDGLTDKSRDMSATWDHIVAFVHRFLFRSSESHLMISRKEDAVDQLDGQPKNYPHGNLADPGTLFGKIDYILSRLPEWMLPRMNRKKMHLVNLDNGSRIDGESANATAGSSDRRTSIFMDEMAKMKEGESIKRSTRDVTACRLVCSTPNGAGTAYSKWRLSGTIEVFTLPWWRHPEKGLGRYLAQDELGRWKIRSPWYDHECTVRSPKEIAIELDMDHIGSGALFFESMTIEEHKKLYAKEPRMSMNINWKKEFADVEIPELITKRKVGAVMRTPRGPLQVWCNFHKGRPDQTKTYTLGVDISKGQGASNSVCAVICNETREIIMEWADANTPPYEFARAITALAVWVGGRNKLPLIVWENNGDPGFDFGRQLVHVYAYPNIYYDRVEGTIAEKRGKRYGWRSSQEQKATALGSLRRAFAHGGIVDHSTSCLEEALTYIYFENGSIGPATLMEENVNARKTHGDRVIARACCLLGLNEAPTMKPAKPEGSEWSVGGRLKSFKRREKQRKKVRGNRFNFAQGAST